MRIKVWTSLAGLGLLASLAACGEVAVANKDASSGTNDAAADDDAAESDTVATADAGPTDTTPEDVTTGPKLVAQMDCAKSRCADDYKGCIDVATCAQVIACLGTCKDDACAHACAKKDDDAANAALGKLGVCAISKACFSPAGTCGDGKCGDDEQAFTCPYECKGGGGTKPECGNGFCDNGETAATCPQDCGGTTEPKCGDGKCDGPKETNANCPADCKALKGTCKDLCGKFTSGNSCQCDPQCVSAGDCCPDHKQLCSAQTCAEKQCVEQVNKCKGTKECSKSWDCLAKCNMKVPCAETCNGGKLHIETNPILKCSTSNGCGK